MQLNYMPNEMTINVEIPKYQECVKEVEEAGYAAFDFHSHLDGTMTIKFALNK